MIKQKIDDLFWNFYAKSYSSIAKSYIPYIEMKKEVIDKIVNNKKKSNEIIFDCGCGTGDYYKDLINRNFRVIGLDFSSRMLTNVNSNNKNGLLIRGDLNLNIPLADESVDQILSVNNLYILNDPNLLLDEWYRILKPGGKLNLVNLTEPLNLLEMNKEYLNKYGIKEYSKMFKSQFLNGLCGLYISAQMKKGNYIYNSLEEHIKLVKNKQFKVEFKKHTYICDYDAYIIASKKD
jgi:ubiquinone/menaquinone biosynthesis C-methylase UbiE